MSNKLCSCLSVSGLPESGYVSDLLMGITLLQQKWCVVCPNDANSAVLGNLDDFLGKSLNLFYHF